MLIDINGFNFFLSLSPILLLLILMVKFQLPSFKAAPIVLALSLITGVLIFKGTIFLIFIELLKASWSALLIILVVFTAILIYEVTEEAKSFSTLNEKLKIIAPNELIRLLGIAMVFVSFLQGATGFGVPIAVTSPLLIAMNVNPLYAVIFPLLGHAWGGTFGTLAVAWLSLVAESSIPDNLVNKTALFAGIYLWILNFSGGVFICYFYGKWKAIKKGFLAVVIFSTIQGGGELLLTQINPVLAAFLPSCIALVSFLLVSKLPMYKYDWSILESSAMNRNTYTENLSKNKGMNLFDSFFPYIVMTSLTLSLLLQPDIKALLSSVKIGFDFPETVTGLKFVNEKVANYGTFSPLSHSSTYLFISALIGYFYYKKRGYIKNTSLSLLIKKAAKRTVNSSIAILTLIMMSKIMAGTGQIYVLAKTISTYLGDNYVFVAPLVGTLGCFITSSNMSSNILFSNFQYSMASMLNLNAQALLGAQTGGASIGTSIAPSNITLGTTTANIVGQEGKVLKVTLPIAIFMTIMFGVLLYFFNIIWE